MITNRNNNQETQRKKLEVLWGYASQGDRAAFANVHHILYPKLYSYSLTLIQDEDLVNDLLQELFIKFWVNRDKIATLHNVKAYIIKSVRFMILNHIKLSHYKAAKISQIPFHDIEFCKEQDIINSETDFQIKSTLENALCTLPEKQREVIYLRFYHGLGYNQIADLTGVQYQSVVNHVYRAIQTLKNSAHLRLIYAA